jgi:primosomal protein N''
VSPGLDKTISGADSPLPREPSAEAEFYVEEMKEALLDLKFAIIDGSAPQAEFFSEEVRLLLFELRFRSPEL